MEISHGEQQTQKVSSGEPGVSVQVSTFFFFFLLSWILEKKLLFIGRRIMSMQWAEHGQTGQTGSAVGLGGLREHRASRVLRVGQSKLTPIFLG